MEQYKHSNLKITPLDADKDKVKHLEEQVSRLEYAVQQLSQRVEFLQRQDQRSRSSFETIQARINARK